jgi:hypothetical protein
MKRLLETKPARELTQFERFAISCAQVPTGPRFQPRPPEPDIVVGRPEKQIGVELTDIHPTPHGTEKRRREGEQESCIAAAKKIYATGGSLPVNVWISWTHHAPLRNRVAVAARLANLISGHPLEGNGLHTIGSGFDVIADLPIVAINIARARSHEDSEWRDGDAHEVGFCRADYLQARIRNEDLKVTRYNEEYDERWLVLVLRGSGPSSWADLDPETHAAEFQSLYDRVFVFDDVYGQSQELRLRPSS